MDKAVEYERDKYDKQRSISFTNWVTTDGVKIRLMGKSGDVFSSF